jgi:hypothetical protein
MLYSDKTTEDDEQTSVFLLPLLGGGHAPQVTGLELGKKSLFRLDPGFAFRVSILRLNVLSSKYVRVHCST